MAYTFDEEFLNSLRLKCDIENVVSKYVQLKRSGTSLIGLCPFHSEKTPSFHVNNAKQFYYCFGCHAGGDVITFVMKTENLSYPEAVVLLAEQQGMEVPVSDKHDNEISKLRANILKMNRDAARFFYNNLMSQNGLQALEYLQRRALSNRIIVRFGLGYSLNKWDGLYNYLLEKAYKKDDIKASGLVTVNGEKVFDRFRNRVMFPIIDRRNNIIGFGGRALGDDPAKYLNTSETIAFKKGNNLYALNLAKNSKDKRLILCEGYMDVIALHQAGFDNAVATLGTALTQQQAKLIKQTSDEVIICYDNDVAGKNATKKAIGILNSVDLKVRVLTVSGSKDPDDYIREYGAERFAKLIDGSQNKTDYKIDEIKMNYNIDIPSEKAECLKDIISVLVEINNSIEQEIYIEKVSEEFRISKESISAEIEVSKRRRAAYKKKMDEKREMETLRETAGNLVQKNVDKFKAEKAEEDIISIFLNFPEKYEFISQNISEKDFVTDFGAKIYKLLLEKIPENPTIEPLMLLSQHVNDAEMGKLTSLIKESRAFEIDKQKITGLIELIKTEKQNTVIQAKDVDFNEKLNLIKKRKNQSDDLKE